MSARRPEWTPEQRDAAEVGYRRGYEAALALAAERVDELDALWQPIERPSHEEQVARRVAEMARIAADNHARLGTAEWVGLDNCGVLPSADWGSA